MSNTQKRTIQRNDTEIFYKNIAKHAIRELKQEEKENQKKATLHNTELLLNKYFDIKDAIEDQDLAFFIDGEQIILSSVLRNKANARLLLEYVDMCIEKLKKKFPEKSKILEIMYFTPQHSHLSWTEKIYMIYEQSRYLFGEVVSERTITRWRKEMVDELSLSLFKADGIKIWTL